MDNCMIFGSPLGMYSLLRGDYIISVLRDDGSLDEKKLNSLVRRIANMGANALRDFFWIDTEEAYEKISPFWKNPDGSFEFNPRYYEIQGKTAETCNRYGIRYYLSLFDHCGTKRGVGNWNPWRFFSDFFYGKDAMEARHEHIDRVLKALEGFDAGIELCNEPKAGQAAFLADTFIHLVKKGFDPRKIILGIDYHLKEKKAAYGKDYREFREKVCKALNTPGKDWAKLLKTECISPVHNATEKHIEELWGPNVKPGGDRRILYSMDGVRKPRPDRETMYRIAKKVLEKKTGAREKGKVLFEVVYGKTKNDPPDSLEGISKAYKETWLVSPGNYKKYTEGEQIEVEPVSPARVQVIHGYRGILGRDPDPGGLQNYVDLLKGGWTVLQFCQALLLSDEFNGRSINLSPSRLAHRLYKGILDRQPDPKGLSHTIEEIQDGRTAERAAAMIESPEFKKKNGGKNG